MSIKSQRKSQPSPNPFKSDFNPIPIWCQSSVNPSQSDANPVKCQYSTNQSPTRFQSISNPISIKSQPITIHCQSGAKLKSIRQSNENQMSIKLQHHRNTMPIWWCQYYKSRKCIQFDYNPMSIQQKSVANQVSIQFNLMPIWCQSNDNPCQCQCNTKISGQSANFRTI